MFNLHPIFQSLKTLQTEFQQNPTLYFTEHDIASRAYALVQEALQYQTVTGKDGNSFYLVHHEYPTPFRCDMSGSNFTKKDEGERTEDKKGKFQRGHYDLVVFNPNFLQECTSSEAKGQDYEQLKRIVPQIINKIKEPAILLGIEFMLNRDPYRSQKQAERWFAKVKQDYDKLQASQTWDNQTFMQDYLMLAFDSGERTKYSEQVENKFQGLAKLIYCFP
jgi:hypothetical protein